MTEQSVTKHFLPLVGVIKTNPKKGKEMQNPYKERADAVDEKIRSLYPKGNEPDLTPDDNNDLSLDANESNQGAMTGADESVPQEPEEAAVPESKYKAAVVEMNKKQQEAAELRKEVAALKEQLAGQSTATATEPTEEEAEEESGEDEMSFDDFEEENSEMPADKQDDFDSLIAELEDVGLGDFVPVLRLLKAENDELKEQISKLGNVADHYIGYQKQRQTDAWWNVIREAHPDLQSFIPPSNVEYEDYTPEQKKYADWYAEQDEETQAMLAPDNPPETVIEGLNKFRADVPKQTENPAEMEEKAAPSVAVVVAENQPTPSKKLEQAKAVDMPKVPKSGEKTPTFNRRLTQEEWHKLSRTERDAYNKWLDEQMSSS